MRLALAFVVALSAAPAAAQPLDHFEVVTGGAAESDPLPMIVVMHGRGDDPARWRDRIGTEVSVRARVILVRAPLRLGRGYEWFRYAGEGAPVSGIATQIAEAIPRVLATIDAVAGSRPTVGRPIVTGFSQGAMMTYALALAHPERIAAAFPVAGFALPRTLRALRDPASVPPIVAFHGTADRVIPVDADRRTVRALRARGVRVELREHAGVGHTMDPMGPALMTAIAEAIGR